MPFVIKHKETAQLFSCKLINIYSFEYYGVKNWDIFSEAESELEDFLHEQGMLSVNDWEIIELSEHQMKMCNVKLNNNSKRRIFLTDEGSLEIK